MTKTIGITKVTSGTIRPNKDEHAYNVFVAYTNVVNAYGSPVTGFGNTKGEAIKNAFFFADLWINTFHKGAIV